VARHLSHVTTENGPRLIGKLVSHGILPRKRCETYRLSRVKTLTGPSINLIACLPIRCS
jgi:hypothetical protein